MTLQITYALLDAIIDGYFPVLEKYGEVMEDLEDRVVMCPDSDNVRELHQMSGLLTGARLGAPG